MNLMTIQELSETLSVRPKTLYQWVALKQIPHLKLNSLVRFDREEIKTWLKECKKETHSSYNPLTTQIRGPRRKEG